jgi:hypothetical protein
MVTSNDVESDNGQIDKAAVILEISDDALEDAEKREQPLSPFRFSWR